MALQKKTTSPHGFEVDQAYYRIESLVFDSKATIRFYVRVYKDPKFAAFDTLQFSCDYKIDSSDNPFKQAYMFLKTLEEFANAIDC